MSRDVFEVSTVGIDEALQGISSDPYGAAAGVSTGLRVPQFAGPNRYLFCLASRTVSRPVRIRGLRQLLTIGFNAAPTSEIGQTERPVELNVTTPTFRFIDGNVSWHLVREPNVRTVSQIPVATNSQSFLFKESNTQPALLYQSATWVMGFGPPSYYNVNMTSYVPPILTPSWKQIGGLGNMHDLRFPWDAARSWDSLDIPVPVQGGEQRISLYASVLQTNPAGPARQLPGLPEPPPNGGNFYQAGVPIEEAFVANFTDQQTGVGPIYWRIAGSIIFEDDRQCVENPSEIPTPTVGRQR